MVRIPRKISLVVSKMKPGGGKSKGSQFEREVCVALSRWVSNGAREDLFWRSAMSGGRATVRGRKGKNTNAQVGDISSIAPAGHALTNRYVIEAKFYADLEIDAFLFKGKGKLSQFWAELNRVARKEKRYPLLIAKQNWLAPFMLSTPAGMEELGFFEHVCVAAVSSNAHLVFLSNLEKVQCPL